MGDYYEELADVEEFESLKKVGKKQKLNRQETIEIAQ